MASRILSIVVLPVLFILFSVSNVALAVPDNIIISTEVTGAAPVPVPGEAFPIPGASFPLIYDLSVSKITVSSAEISWVTTKEALCKIFWGKTAEYKDGGIAETGFGKSHLITLNGLRAQTQYHFRVSCEDKTGAVIETGDQLFMTLTPADHIPPANVRDFSAIAGDGKIELNWKNPPDFDFQGVRIVKSDKFYPSNIQDGEIIYEGAGASLTDTNVENGKRYYYTAFAFDRNRNYASGAIASAFPQAMPEGVVPPIPPEEVVPTAPPPEEVDKIKLEDFDFFIGGKQVFPKDGRIGGLESNIPFTISVKYGKVPEVLKTIMVTLEKENKFFSFLLKVNEEKTVYEATIIPPEETGVYPMIITILDYKNQTLKRIKGEIVVEKSESKKVVEGLTLGGGNINITKILYNFIIYALIAFILYIISRLIKRIFRKEKVKYGY